MQVSSFDSLLIRTLGFAIYFVSLWSLISFAISWMSGWLTLSKRFGADSVPYGDVKSAGPFFYTIYVRFWAHYSSVIRITAAQDGLYLSVLFLFRLGHPPLRIPWDEVEFSKTKRLWQQYVVLTLGKEERVIMRISVRMAQKLGILNRLRETSGNTAES